MPQKILVGFSETHGRPGFFSEIDHLLVIVPAQDDDMPEVIEVKGIDDSFRMITETEISQEALCEAHDIEQGRRGFHRKELLEACAKIRFIYEECEQVDF